MSTTSLIVGLALGMLLGGLIIAFRGRYRDVFGILLALGIVVLAVAVTIIRVNQYQDRKPAPASLADNQAAGPTATPPGAVPKPPVSLPNPAPFGRGLTGGAAPPAVENPYAGGNR